MILTQYYKSVCVHMCKDKPWIKIYEGGEKRMYKDTSWKKLCTPIYISYNFVILFALLFIIATASVGTMF